MLCKICHAEYLNNIKICGECNSELVDASPLDLPVPNMDWISLPSISGKIHVDMIIDILNKNGIPHYLKSNWMNATFSIEGTSNLGDISRIFVPKRSEEQALNIMHIIIGEN